jgi:hypothetical protein
MPRTQGHSNTIQSDIAKERKTYKDPESGKPVSADVKKKQSPKRRDGKKPAFKLCHDHSLKLQKAGMHSRFAAGAQHKNALNYFFKVV